jgi:hypothetical protein
MAHFLIRDKETIKKIIIPLFDNINLRTSKYYDYLNFKKALLITEEKNLTQIEKIEKIRLIDKEIPINYISPTIEKILFILKNNKINKKEELLKLINKN